MSYTKGIIDPNQYPLTTRYLANLPAGLDSYTDCLVKTDVHDNIRKIWPQNDSDNNLPPILLSYINNTYQEEWYPDVAGCTLLMMLRDKVFSTDSEAVNWVNNNMESIYKRPMYRMLMLVLSPSLIALGATKRWAAFHRGSTLTAGPIVRDKDGLATTDLTLIFPAYLFNEMHVRQYAAAYCTALRNTRGQNPQVFLNGYSSTEAKYIASWKD
ncbi:MAG: hypothetical protein JW841_17450 [Deltaproteobacteria bacterium]|nr:hypothetical protein [Deltaproteobacteria bacterium]